MKRTTVMFCFFLVLFHSISNAQSQLIRRPNIVLLITDDQDVMLDSMSVMNETKKLFGQHGVEFTNAFTTTPICCPSRSSILTGLYTHNHHVYTNKDNCSSILWQRFYETKSYATYLNRSGYHTGYFGKYLNEYNGSYTPPGWDYWMGLTKNSRYYNYTLIHNGVKELHGDDYSQDYLTDLVANRSMDFFKASKQEDPERPVLAVLSFPAPHGPEDGAPQYQNLYSNVTSHITRSFDHVPNPYKHWIVRQCSTPMDKTQLRFSQLLQQKRLQTMRSVDDNVKKVIDTLREINELENTYIMYFSDHGYHIGQFGIPKGKSMPYEFDIRIPFLLQGPNIPRGRRAPQIALNIDIAPTILGMAGVSIPPELDGRNLLEIFDERKLKAQPWRDSFLIERGKMPRDRAHLVKPKLVKENKMERLRKLCESPNYKHPCDVGQFWTCMKDDSKIRLQKCRPERKAPSRKRKNRKKKYCACPMSANERRSADGEQSVPLRCGAGYDSTGHSKSRNGGRRSRLSKRNSFRQYAQAVQRRALTAYGNLRKRGPIKGNSRRRFKRDTSDALDADAERNTGGRSRDSSMILTSQCRLYMPNFEIRCMEDLYNNPYEWVKHMGHLARSVKTLQIKMKYMKALRSCLNKYDEGVRKKSVKKCECPQPPTKPPKVKAQMFVNVTHPLSGLDDIDDHNKLTYEEKLREFNERRNTLRMIKEMRQAKLARIQKREQKGGKHSKKCGTQGLKCFKLMNTTWATNPKWDGEERCYCVNSNNNTYWCLRILNEHTNVLYCQFITGFIEFYNLNVDPHQLVNNQSGVSVELHSALHSKLAVLRGCKGLANCSVGGFSRMPELSAPAPSLDDRESLSTNQDLLEQADEELFDEDEEIFEEGFPPLDPMESLAAVHNIASDLNSKGSDLDNLDDVPVFNKNGRRGKEKARRKLADLEKGLRNRAWRKYKIRQGLKRKKMLMSMRPKNHFKARYDHRGKEGTGVAPGVRGKRKNKKVRGQKRRETRTRHSSKWHHM